MSHNRKRKVIFNILEKKFLFIILLDSVPNVNE